MTGTDSAQWNPRNAATTTAKAIAVTNAANARAAILEELTFRRLSFRKAEQLGGRWVTLAIEAGVLLGAAFRCRRIRNRNFQRRVSAG